MLGTDHKPSTTGEPAATLFPDPLAGSPYRALHEIGRGGMAIVYEAEHRQLGKRVVVKLLLPARASHERIADRFRREAKVLAHLRSPYVVEVSDFGQTPAGDDYLVMERLHGHTLREELKARGGSLPIGEAILWTRQVLAGLAAVHRVGIVHRDVKLDNVFLCDATEHEGRRVKLLDFGIVKILNVPGQGAFTKQPFTVEGALLGTPRWLAPEQARGGSVDHRADIYTTGLLLYTLLCGRGPFAHRTGAVEAIEAHLSESPEPPSSYAPQQYIPKELDEVVLAALAKRSDDRFQTAEAFAGALEAVAARLGDITQPLPGPCAPLPPSSGPGLASPPPSAPVAPLLPVVSTLLAEAADEELRESSAPTLVRAAPPSSSGAAPPSAAAEPRRVVDLDFDDPTVERRAGGPILAASAAAQEHVGSSLAQGRRRLSIFVALMAASMIVFLALIAAAWHLFGARLAPRLGTHAAGMSLSSPEARRGALRLDLSPAGLLFSLDAKRPRWHGPTPQRSTIDPRA